MESLLPSSFGNSIPLLAAALLTRCKWTLGRSSRSFWVVDKELRLLVEVVLPLGRNVVSWVDRIDRAGGKASIAVHALVRVDPQLLFGLVDTVNRTLVDAGTVLY